MSSADHLSDDPEQAGCRKRIAGRAEDAIGRLADDLIENPVINSALSRAFSAREKVAQAQQSAMDALNLPSASELEKLGRRLRTISQRLEEVEDAVEKIGVRMETLGDETRAPGAQARRSARPHRGAARGARSRRRNAASRRGARKASPASLRRSCPRARCAAVMAKRASRAKHAKCRAVEHEVHGKVDARSRRTKSTARKSTRGRRTKSTAADARAHGPSRRARRRRSAPRGRAHGPDDRRVGRARRATAPRRSWTRSCTRAERLPGAPASATACARPARSAPDDRRRDEGTAQRRSSGSQARSRAWSRGSSSATGIRRPGARRPRRASARAIEADRRSEVDRKQGHGARRRRRPGRRREATKKRARHEAARKPSRRRQREAHGTQAPSRRLREAHSSRSG